MHFDVIQTVSVNGNAQKPNDDRCGANTHLAWVIDGATDMSEPGLLGSQGGAAWLASTASAAFAVSEARDMQKTCQTAFSRIEDQFVAQRTREVAAPWEVPKAAFAAALLIEEKLSVAWAADSPVLLMSGDDAVWCTGEPDTSAESADALSLGPGVGAASVLSDTALENRRAHRARADHIALSPDAQASAGVTRYADFDVSVGDELLLMSDGFASIVTDYAAYTAREMVSVIRSEGLGRIVDDLRAIEQADAACLRFPRFKVSDDATAIWVRVSG